MTIHAHRFAYSAALAMSFCYLICAALLYIIPQESLAFAAQFFLLRSLELLAPYLQVTIQNIVSGLIQTLVFSYLIAWLWASIYNWGENKNGVIR